jgi:hypothetical protein
MEYINVVNVVNGFAAIYDWRMGLYAICAADIYMQYMQIIDRIT